jgi:hypothetical protein
MAGKNLSKQYLLYSQIESKKALKSNFLRGKAIKYYQNKTKRLS